MSDPSSSVEIAPLGRLAGDEAELERRLEEARRLAAETIAGARGEAERITAEARLALEAGLARHRAETEALVATEAARSEASARDAAAELARRAERNGERALSRIVALALGRGSP